METPSSQPEETRDYLLYGSGGMAASGLFPASAPSALDDDQSDEFSKKRAAVIGRFRHSDVDDQLTAAFKHFPDIEVVAFADFDHSNLAQNQGRFGAARAFTDYRDMFETVEPDLVAIGSGFGLARHHMMMAALRAEAHVYCEGPIASSLGRADEIVSLADSMNLKVSIANPLRFDPTVREFDTNSRALIGEIVEMRIYGKMGSKCGGKDLASNGWPLFDLARSLGGEPETCCATVLKDGRPITREDGEMTGSKELGPVAGDDIVAHFTMSGGIHTSFISRSAMQMAAGGWGIEFIGSRCKAQLFAADPAGFVFSQHIHPGGPLVSRHFPLRCPPEDPEAEYGERNAMEDWLDAIAEDREPVCSAASALKSMEMAHSIFRSGLTGTLEKLPLENRSHPLEPRFAGPL